MAALSGCGIHNALIDIDGPEVPILDGSAVSFVAGLLKAGQRELSAPLIAIEVLAPVEIRDGDAVARLEPADTLEIAFSIDFAAESSSCPGPLASTGSAAYATGASHSAAQAAAISIGVRIIVSCPRSSLARRLLRARPQSSRRTCR